LWLTEESDANRLTVRSGSRAALVAALFEGYVQDRTQRWSFQHRGPESHDVGDDEVCITQDVDGRRVWIWLTAPGRHRVRECLEDGPASLLSADASEAELHAALEFLQGGPAFISRSIVQVLAEAEPTTKYRLTPREQEVVRLVAQGASNREIASALFVSPNTVRSHLQAIAASLGVRSRGRIAARARELQLA
jgi:DNA-binding NarL/FixJ family response regulator